MTLKQALARARAILGEARIEDVPLEAELLLRHTLGIDRVQMFIELEHELNPEQESGYFALVERRRGGEPTAYITGCREFYGLDFQVSPAVLIPRPETEMLVEEASRLCAERRFSNIADIGTGSGAIAVSLALRLPQVAIYATDISEAALEVARSNCRRHGVTGRVKLLRGDLLGPLPSPVDLIIANLPYVPRAEIASDSFEPRLALDGGEDGLDQVKRLCGEVAGHLKRGGSLLLEIGRGQSAPLLAYLHSVFPQSCFTILKDPAGIDRVIKIGDLVTCPLTLFP